MDQRPLFDSKEGARRRDAAITRVGDAHRGFVSDAVSAVVHVISRQDHFTTDDVWEVLIKRGVKAPREPRAMGAAMKEAQRSGLIIPTDRVRHSRRTACHRRPLRIWRAVGV